VHKSNQPTVSASRLLVDQVESIRRKPRHLFLYVIHGEADVVQPLTAPR
jgi:hypothetical protein